MIADMATDISGFLTYHAAYLKDQGLPYSKTAMAKLFASEWPRHLKAVQITGAMDILKARRWSG